MILCLLCLSALAVANGANDVSRAAATLVGGGVASYKRALRWTIAWTFAGSVLSGWLAAAVARRFAAVLGTNSDFLLAAIPAVLIASSCCVGLATYRRLPVATTHTLVGSLLGVTWCAGGWAACGRIDLAKGFIVPLVASPILAAVCAAVLRVALPASWGAESLTMRGGHFFSAGATALSRGMNDSAKIWAILIPLGILLEKSSRHFVELAQVTVAVAMLLGSYCFGRRVTSNVAFGLNPMSSADSTVANVVTATVIIAASLLSFPVASSHVICGAILGVGLVSNRRLLRWNALGQIAAAWVLTLPCAFLLAVAFYSALHRGWGSMAWIEEASIAAVLMVAALALWIYRRSARSSTLLKASRLIVFVCNSNTSRSPMAAQICEWLLETVAGSGFSRSAGVRVVSRGIGAKEGEAMADPARVALRRWGFSARSHAASNLSLELMQEAAIVFCMTEAQREQVVGMFGSCSGKVYRLDPSRDIPNPAGRLQSEFDRVAQMLLNALRIRVSELLEA